MRHPENTLSRRRLRALAGVGLAALMMIGSGGVEARPALTWHGQDHMLTYGPANDGAGGAVGELYCDPRGVRVSFFRRGLREGPAQVRVQSGRQNASVGGYVSTETAEYDLPAVSATLSFSSALTRRILGGAAVQISARGQSAQLPAVPRAELTPFVAACHAMSETAPTTVDPPVDPNAPAWESAVSNEGTPFLTTSVGRVFHRFTCVGRGRVNFETTLRGGPGPRPVVLLRSGAASQSVPVQVFPEGSGFRAEGALPAGSAVMAAFGRTGQIQFVSGGHTMTPSPAAPATVAAYRQACARFSR